MPESPESLRSAPASANGVGEPRPSRRRIGLPRWFDLRLSIVFAVVVGLALPNLFFAFGDGKSAEDRALESLQADLEQVADILAAAMRDPLWQVSPDLGRPMLQAMFRDERLVAVVVHEASSEVPFLDIYRSVSATAPALSRARSIFFDGREIGSIRVTMSAGPALAKHRSDREESRLRLLASTVLAVLLVVLVMHWRLMRPLTRLLRQSPGRPTDATDWRGIEELRPLVDELDRLGRSPNDRRRGSDPPES